MRRVYELLADIDVEQLAELDGDDELTLTLRIAVCDASVRGRATTAWTSCACRGRGRKEDVPVRGNVEHLVRGARWACTRLQHGDADVIEAGISVTTEQEQAWDRPIPYDSPIPWDSSSLTVRFVQVDAERLADLDEGDRWTQRSTAAVSSGGEVGEVCGWLLNGGEAASARPDAEQP